MAETNASTIATNATLPKKAEGDEGSVEQHSIPDQIAADKHNKQGDLLASVESTGRLPIFTMKRIPTWPS